MAPSQTTSTWSFKIKNRWRKWRGISKNTPLVGMEPMQTCDEMADLSAREFAKLCGLSVILSDEQEELQEDCMTLTNLSTTTSSSRRPSILDTDWTFPDSQKSANNRWIKRLNRPEPIRISKGRFTVTLVSPRCTSITLEPVPLLESPLLSSPESHIESLFNSIMH